MQFSSANTAKFPLENQFGAMTVKGKTVQAEFLCTAQQQYFLPWKNRSNKDYTKRLFLFFVTRFEIY